MIERVSPEQLISLSRGSLSLPAQNSVEETYIASLLRRAAGIYCPCSPRTLASAVRNCLRDCADPEHLDDMIESCLEGLMIIGDLLELGQVSVDDPNVKGTWIFAAPPAFVVRPSGSIFIVGIAADELTPLPTSLADHLEHRGFARLINDATGKLREVLRDTGLLELSESVWLRSPKEETAAGLRDRMLALLFSRGPSGTIEDLEILDPSSPPTYYKGRWKMPKKQSGTFIARRPQAYGAPIWCICRVTDGQATQFLDLPLNDKASALWRGCDAAWHIQMAIDALNGTPQRYRIRQAETGPILDFFSPLPLWARRRLAIFGRTEQPSHCVFSYSLPERELAAEENFLKRRLWLAPTHNSDGGQRHDPDHP